MPDERIGVADLDTVAVVTAALAGKRFRASLGGEWAANLRANESCFGGSKEARSEAGCQWGEARSRQ
jgi:hypothetical protein